MKERELARYEQHLAKSLGKALREARERAGLSGAQVALRIGSSRANVRRFENGEHAPRLITLVRLAKASGTNLPQVLRLAGLIREESWKRDPRSTKVDLEYAGRLSSALKAVRLRARLSQAEVSRRTGIARSNVSRMESGKHLVRLSSARRLAEACGSSVRELMELASD